MDRPGQPVDAESDNGRRQRTDAQLPLDADVEEPTTKRQPDAQAGKDVRRGPQDRLGDGVGPPEGSLPEPAVRQDRVTTSNQDQHRTECQCRQDGKALRRDRLREGRAHRQV
jgi:hypothetical protein